MLSDDPFNISRTRRFFSFAEEEIYEVNLPELKSKHCIGSADGWVITMDSNFVINMFNVFSKRQRRLPRHPMIHQALFSSLLDVVVAIVDDDRKLALAMD